MMLLTNKQTSKQTPGKTHPPSRR